MIDMRRGKYFVRPEYGNFDDAFTIYNRTPF